MSKNRFVIDTSRQLLEHEIIRLSEQEAHHLAKVLRIKLGEQVGVFERSLRKSYLAEVTCLGDRAEIKILKSVALPSLLPITVLAASVRAEVADSIVQKAVEFGVSKLVFFQAERSQDSLRGDRLEKRLSRFERIALSALKQSGSSSPPELTLATSLEQALKDSPRCEYNLICLEPSLNLQASNIIKLITSQTAASPLSPKPPLENIPQVADFSVVIGPEGGFSRSEVELCLKYSYQPVSLGPFTLRSETAALATMAILASYCNRS